MSKKVILATPFGISPGTIRRVATSITSSLQLQDVQVRRIEDMPNYKLEKMANSMRSEVARLQRVYERKEALARCIKPYIKVK